MSAHILIVEDHGDSRKLLTWLLEDAGYRVTGCATAEAALAWLAEQMCDLVLMDISLPRLDGKAATRRLRADPRCAHLPIIAVSAHAVTGELEAIRAAGLDDVVTKPIDEQRLLALLRARLPAEAVP